MRLTCSDCGKEVKCTDFEMCEPKFMCWNKGDDKGQCICNDCMTAKVRSRGTRVIELDKNGNKVKEYIEK